jgi:hypothetical protein
MAGGRSRAPETRRRVYGTLGKRRLDASLGQMIGQIRFADVSKPLSNMNVLHTKLEEINEYCTAHSHGDSALVMADCT